VFELSFLGAMNCNPPIFGYLNFIFELAFHMFWMSYKPKEIYGWMSNMIKIGEHEIMRIMKIFLTCHILYGQVHSIHFS
jgi:hypothetical protein